MENNMGEREQQTSRWQRLRHWLGFIGSTSQREGNKVVSDSQPEQGASTDGETIVTVLERLRERRQAQQPAGFADPLELGPQLYGDPEFFKPPADIESYRAGLRRLDKMEPPHVLAERLKQEPQQVK